jgi:CheY-like chemotaxis protein
MVSLAFEERGIDVVSVGNGEAAVRRIPDLTPDLVLADVFMPVRNGYEVCEFVKKDDRFSHVPVILLVGAFDPLDEKEARRVGADGVLKKPFVPPDPLIAMVTSALEKNPKVAAEMARAREAAAAPPQAEPMAPVLEAPARMEPKPLPDFPEPSPEEAAQIYGFGKGVRSTDDDATPENERESPKSLKAPKASSKNRAEEEEDQDDDSMTAHDWRRSAADFEVPDEPGGRLPFASDENFNPITFPSEREVPPKHVSTTEFEEAETPEPVQARAEQPQVDAFVESKPTAADVAAPTDSVAEIKAIALPEPAPIPSIQARELESEPIAPKEEEASAHAEFAAPEISVEKAVEPAQPAGHGSKSKIGAWMDMMASPSEYSEGGWLSSIFGHRSENKAQKQKEAAAQESPETVSDNVSNQQLARVELPKIELAKIEPPLASEVHDTPPSIVASTTSDLLPVDNSPELNAPELKAAQPEMTLPDSPGPDLPEPESWFAPPPPPVLRDASESTPLLALTKTSKTDSEFLPPPPDVTGSHRDPALEEPASASRVVPEPLLVRDDAEPSEPSRFSRAAEQPAPLHSFFAPASGDPGTDSATEQHDPAQHEDFNTSIFAPPVETVSPSAEVSERIPTGPPPNREALADIPFLMPPPPSPFERKSDNSATDPVQVDAVVAKVMEKLEPQLHQLLSQGLLKPLVENLLQQELEKKQK